MSVQRPSHTSDTTLQAGFGVLLVALYYVAQIWLIPTLPDPTSIVEALATQLEQGLIDAIADALRAILLGFVIAVVVGIPLGVLMGVNRVAERLIDPYVNALYVIPYAALVPAFIIWFGTGFTVRLVVTFMFALFPITINTLEGAKTTPINLIEVARSFNAGRLFVLKNVVLPHELPYILAGLRLGVGRAVKGLVVAEILISVSGIGGILTQWSAAYRLEGVASIVLILMGLGIVLPWVFNKIYDRVIWWDV
ncbi:MAG: ABC transporter permease, partial [Halobacteriales archaeon]|nr:ABC transporter permease [Halobacteriales archaeon]